MRGGRVAIAVVAVVLLGLVAAGSALACSCAPSTPVESLARSDAAITGRLLAVAPHGATHAEYRYEVLRVYRGREAIAPSSVLRVLSPRGSAACALPDGIGRRFGLFLEGDRGRWTSGLCGVISPRRLRSAARKPGGNEAAGAGPSCTS